jgi:peroxiredoxin
MFRTAFLAATVLLSGARLSVGQTPPAMPAVGQKAPGFSLSTPTGQTFTLDSFSRGGPVALIVLRGYPGYQCPYCVRQVRDFVENAGKFATAGTHVVLVYPGPPADLDQRAKEFLAAQSPLPANVTLLIDPDYTFTNQYGLRWDAPRETAYPSTFLIDRKGVIFYRKVSQGHGDRSTAADVLVELQHAK